MVTFDAGRASPQMREVLFRWFESGADGSGVVARADEDTERSLLAGVEGGGAATARLYSLEQVGSCVVAAGSVRITHDGGFSESTLCWLFRFRDGRFARIERYANPEAAVAAAQADAQ
jgi:hypothetical protein